VHIDIQLDLGSGGKLSTPKSYRLSLSVPGGAPQVFDALPFADEGFCKFGWLGFSSVGRPGSVVYLDNIRLVLEGK
jgi:hypothetical protein